jgi:hypothetical protein|tara:strand:- start:259 stop:543 length:285 start_codon:yes stop_codon:yes gene_type:complete
MSENDQKKELREFINKYTSLENIVSKFALFTRALYIMSLLAVIVFSIVNMSDFPLGILGSIISIITGYIFLTVLFGLIAIIIQIHEHVKNLAEK